MAKKEGWQKGEGHYSKSDGVTMKRQPDQGYVPPRDISRRVDSASKIDDSFSGKLPSNN
jgi:hypothetical protein